MASPLTIDEFRNFYKKGISKPTRYRVLTTGGSGAMRTLLAESITLPSRSFSTFTDNTYGEVRQFPYRHQYNTELVMTILLSEDQNERLWIEQWMNQFMRPNHHASPYQTYQNSSRMNIYMDSQTDKHTGTYKLYGVYPNSIIPSNYGYAMMNETAKLQVAFNYRRYTFS